MRRRRWCPLTVALLVLALPLSACGGGGGRGDDASSPEDDPAGEAATTGERPVQVTGAGRVRLGGTLLVPPAGAEPAGAKRPAVLFVPAVMSGDRNGVVPLGENAVDPLASDLARAFADSGVVSYRFDGRGTGESKIDPGTNVSLEDLVADARAAIDLLAQRKETSRSDLAVVAYDTGGLVALRLAAVEPRVKRLVLVSSPGQALLDFQAVALGSRFGPESGEALRAAVSQLLATKTVPPLASLRTELRPLLPADRVQFLSELYTFDPVAEAAGVRAQAMIVSPSTAEAVEAMAPQRLAQAIAGSELLLVDGVSWTLQVTGPGPTEDPGDPAGAAHIHGAAPAHANVERDGESVGRITNWLAGPRS